MRLFGVLRGRFNILTQQSFERSDLTLILISQICVILHNMVVDVHQRGELNEEIDDDGHLVNVVTDFDLSAGADCSIATQARVSL